MTQAAISPRLAERRKPRASNTSQQYLVVAVGDLLAFGAAAVLVLLTHGRSAGGDSALPDLMQRSDHWLIVAAWLVWFMAVKQVCVNRKPFSAELQQLVVALVCFAGIDIALSAVVHGKTASGEWVTRWLALFVLMPLARSLSRRLLVAMQLWQRPTLVIGNGENALATLAALRSEPGMGFDVKLFMVPPPEDSTGSVQLSRPQPALAPVCEGIRTVPWSDQPAQLKRLRNMHVVIALEASQRKTREALLRRLTQNGIMDVHVVPAMRGVPLHGLEASQFFSQEVLLIQLHTNLRNQAYQWFKRAFDVVVSTVLLTLLFPLFVYLYFKITADGGPFIYGHTRVGRNGVAFQCLKFRTMVVNSADVLAELLARDPVARAEWEKDFKLKNDPRVNRFGSFLRRSSIDELPQLWNVLRGDMSLVGPRPVVQAELARYQDDVAYYLMSRPGMTGLWQVSGRNDVDYCARVYFDAWYVKNWSLWTDLVILFKTVGVVLKRAGAY
ncbi:MAG: undecaprenyl-phosphate galactose phosphotransferase WbaP [Rhodoferax sp.]|nr:undecaprenyl-phosphate galactose phosphotransferase WbaP [Rhodoferax sp.]